MAINMEYIRIHNTAEALEECADYLDEVDLADLSTNEHKALAKLIVLCRRFVETFDSTDEE